MPTEGRRHGAEEDDGGDDGDEDRPEAQRDDSREQLPRHQHEEQRRACAILVEESDAQPDGEQAGEDESQTHRRRLHILDPVGIPDGAATGHEQDHRQHERHAAHEHTTTGAGLDLLRLYRLPHTQPVCSWNYQKNKTSESIAIAKKHILLRPVNSFISNTPLYLC